MTKQELEKEKELCLVRLRTEQDNLEKIRKQLKDLELPVDYESYVGKCYYEEYDDGIMFYKIIKVIYQTEPVFVTLISNHLGDLDNPSIAIEINFDFTYLQSIKLLEEIDLTDYQEKLRQSIHHLTEIIYNDSTITPYDND